MAKNNMLPVDFITVPPFDKINKRNPLYRIVKFAVGGAIFGLLLGIVIKYNMVVHLFTREAVQKTLSIAHVQKATFWMGSCGLAYALGNEFSILVRGADYYTPAFGGALAGLVITRLPKLKPRGTFVTIGLAAAGGILVDSAKYDPRARYHFHEIHAAQQIKVFEAYAHAMKKAKEQNDQRHAELEAESVKYAH